jgi:hypothetical protein
VTAHAAGGVTQKRQTAIKKPQPLRECAPRTTILKLQENRGVPADIPLKKR